MWEGIASAAVGLAASVWIGGMAFGYWMPQGGERDLAKRLLTAGRADRWSHAASVLLLAVLDQLLRRETRGRRRIPRTAASALAILLLALSLAGLQSRTFLGFEESPWRGYEKTIETLNKTNDRQETRPKDEAARSAISERLRAANAPHWKFMYSVCAILSTLLLYLIAFHVSAKAVRRLILEMNGARTWVQKAGIACFATIALLLWTITLVLVFAFFSSPIPILTASLAHLVSAGWIVAGALAVAVFEFFVSDPWFKALLLASVLPGAALLLTTLLPLALDLAADILANARERAAVVAHDRLGQAFIPLCMTLGAIACIVWFLRFVL